MPLEVAMRKPTTLVAVAVLVALAWITILANRQSIAQRAELKQQAAGAQNWEYETIELTSLTIAYDGKRELNRKGKEGWELCGTASYAPQNNTVLILKRPMK